MADRVPKYRQEIQQVRSQNFLYKDAFSSITLLLYIFMLPEYFLFFHSFLLPNFCNIRYVTFIFTVRLIWRPLVVLLMTTDGEMNGSLRFRTRLRVIKSGSYA